MSIFKEDKTSFLKAFNNEFKIWWNDQRVQTSGNSDLLNSIYKEHFDKVTVNLVSGREFPAFTLKIEVKGPQSIFKCYVTIDLSKPLPKTLNFVLSSDFSELKLNLKDI